MVQKWRTWDQHTLGLYLGLLLQLILNAFDFRQALRKPEQVQLDDAEMQKMKQFDMELERALSRLETKEPGSLHHQM